ncbi:MAG: class I SAM-dependent RNA methyltransferase [Cytophagaceae bacterium]|nr:class I SAM-dependent RNA methyltransferase [Cytophagaceae bacterium]MDW8456125.1 class I SAM-dependent RNA methyltransferase [Cytophagaceae bacterium]
MELKKLGFPVLGTSHMSVETEGSMADCMILNLHLFTAHRVLYLLDSFVAKNPDQLYEGIYKIKWEHYLREDGYFSISSYSDNEHVVDTRYTNLRCKDAIADRMVSVFGKRPDSGPMKNRAVIFVHWKNKDVRVYFDTSGDTISKHGYRKVPWKAPLQESLAAAIIMATSWDMKTHFINPMCGSGTLAIEAALMAQHRAPGLLRSNFGFMHIKGFDITLWNKCRKEAAQKKIKTEGYRIIATDIDDRAIKAAKENAKTAGVNHYIEFVKCPFEETEIPQGNGIVLLNPEYGLRMGEEKHLKATYKAIGDFFKKKCRGYTGYVFTGNLQLAKNIGLRTSKKIEFYNAKIDSRLLEYQLY